jgi:hypothetical protein
MGLSLQSKSPCEVLERVKSYLVGRNGLAPFPKVAADRIRQPPKKVFDMNHDSDSVAAFALNLCIRQTYFAPTRKGSCSGVVAIMSGRSLARGISCELLETTRRS